MKHRRSFSFLKKSRIYRFSDIAYLIFSSAVRFFSAPYVKIIVLITAAVCILMIPVPYLITKTAYKKAMIQIIHLLNSLIHLKAYLYTDAIQKKLNLLILKNISKVLYPAKCLQLFIYKL